MSVRCCLEVLKKGLSQINLVEVNKHCFEHQYRYLNQFNSLLCSKHKLEYILWIVYYHHKIVHGHEVGKKKGFKIFK